MCVFLFFVCVCICVCLQMTQHMAGMNFYGTNSMMGYSQPMGGAAAATTPTSNHMLGSHVWKWCHGAQAWDWTVALGQRTEWTNGGRGVEGCRVYIHTHSQTYTHHLHFCLQTFFVTTWQQWTQLKGQRSSGDMSGVVIDWSHGLGVILHFHMSASRQRGPITALSPSDFLINMTLRSLPV